MKTSDERLENILCMIIATITDARLVDLSTTHNLVIKSTLFEHKNIRKSTRWSNERVTRN